MSANRLILVCFGLWASGLLGCGPNAGAGSTADTALSASDQEFEIKEAVYKDLFDGQDARLHPILPTISGYVIQDPQATRLAASFAGHNPPVTSNPIIRNAAGDDIDHATAQPVEVYSASVRDISCNSADVGAGWHSGILVGVWYSYHLQRVGGIWKIVGKTVVGVS